MEEKYGFYKIYDNSINEITEQIKQNIRLSFNYKKDYEETIQLIKAFNAYKYFVENYLPKIINLFINRKKVTYKHIKDIYYADEKVIDKEMIEMYLLIKKAPVSTEKLIYMEDGHILVNEEIYKEFIGFIKRMIARANITCNFAIDQWQTGNWEELTLKLSGKKLIDCYYNELQALELMEEEVNILKEDYGLVLKK